MLSIKINDQLLPCKLSPDTGLDSHTKTNILGACVTRKSHFYLKLTVLHWWHVWFDMKCKWGRGQARPWTNTNTCSPQVVDFNISSQTQLDGTRCVMFNAASTCQKYQAQPSNDAFKTMAGQLMCTDVLFFACIIWTQHVVHIDLRKMMHTYNIQSHVHTQTGRQMVQR